MKVEFDIDHRELAKEIARHVINSLKAYGEALPDKDKLFTLQELAQYLHVSKQWIYKAVQHKEIPYCKVGRSTRFLKSDIDTWLHATRIPAANNPIGGILRLVKGKREAGESS